MLRNRDIVYLEADLSAAQVIKETTIKIDLHKIQCHIVIDGIRF